MWPATLSRIADFRLHHRAADLEAYLPLRARARSTVQQRYDLRSGGLPAQLKLLDKALGLRK